MTDWAHIKGIVFDLDDTLYPQESYKRSGFAVVAQWFARRYGLPYETTFDQLEAIMRAKGPSYGYIFDDFAELAGLNGGIVPELVEIFVRHEPKIDCFEGVLPMLARLNRKYKTGILTDGRADVQRRKIRSLGLHHQVNAIRCSYASGQAKPDSRLYAWFEEQFQTPGRQLVYVGDNPKKDFPGAVKRNWKTVRVLTGEYASKNLTADIKTDLCLNSVIDLENFLNAPRDGCQRQTPQETQIGRSPIESRR
ncbi:MAG: HAD family hydrolase [Desulfobacterales bacterium]|nr:MAG: HAD family hydrolase [Desulfobacterales bacterium]